VGTDTSGVASKEVDARAGAAASVARLREGGEEGSPSRNISLGSESLQNVPTPKYHRSIRKTFPNMSSVYVPLAHHIHRQAM
jgi:hypothetical protein